MPPFSIKDRAIGPGHPCYIIAEMSANHNQDLAQAEAIIHAAKNAGADAIKLQTYTPDTMTIDCSEPSFVIGKGTLWEGRKLHELYGEACTPWQWQGHLKQLAESIGLHCFSTPFDATAVEFLESLEMPAHKIASFEVVDLPLIRKVAATGKPVIMSTGMATLAEIDEAVSAFRQAGGTQLALLKCTSAYPSPVSEMNLRTIPHLSEAFCVPTGLSDHSMGTVATIAAVALGACIIEKHMTLSRAVPGPDSQFSLEPSEFAEMVRAVRECEAALGRVNYSVTPKEKASCVFRRSLFAVQDVKAGEAFSNANVRIIRPGNGLPPKFIGEVLGRRASRDIVRGTPLSWDLLA